METNELYRMIEALLETSSTAASGPNTSDHTLEQLVRAPAAAPVVETQAAKTSTSQSSDSGIGDTILNTVLGGFPLFSLFKSLFDQGGTEDSVPPLVKYRLPAAVNQSAGYSAGTGFVPLEYSQSGLARTPAPQATQVTVQVNAMYSQSFLDHSDEIASAVRTAVLNSHSLRDVLTEL